MWDCGLKMTNRFKYIHMINPANRHKMDQLASHFVNHFGFHLLHCRNLNQAHFRVFLRALC